MGTVLWCFLNSANVQHTFVVEVNYIKNQQNLDLGVAFMFFGMNLFSMWTPTIHHMFHKLNTLVNKKADPSYEGK